MFNVFTGTKSRLISAAFLSLAITGSAGAQTEKPVLTVYTYSSFAGEYGPGASVKARFEQTCGCTLEWVETDDAGTLLARLKLEGEKTRADVVLGLDTNLMADEEASGLFQPHGVPVEGLAVPSNGRAKPLSRSIGAGSPLFTTRRAWSARRRA